MLWRTECADMVVLLAISRFLLALIVAKFATIFRGASLVVGFAFCCWGEEGSGISERICLAEDRIE